MRVVDAFLSLPWILKMLVLIVTFGTGVEVLIPTLAFFYGIPVVRIARAATHNVVARDFVVAARARGHGRMSIIRRELLPNVLDTLMVEGAMRWSCSPNDETVRSSLPWQIFVLSMGLAILGSVSSNGRCNVRRHGRRTWSSREIRCVPVKDSPARRRW